MKIRRKSLFKFTAIVLPVFILVYFLISLKKIPESVRIYTLQNNLNKSYQKNISYSSSYQLTFDYFDCVLFQGNFSYIENRLKKLEKGLNKHVLEVGAIKKTIQENFVEDQVSLLTPSI